MLKSFFTKVSVLFIFTFLPFALLANTEIIDKRVKYEVVNSVIKDFKKENVKGFTIAEIKLKSFDLSSNVNPKKSIKIIPLKLVIDDVIVFRTETSSATELMAYHNVGSAVQSNNNTRFFTPG